MCVCACVYAKQRNDTANMGSPNEREQPHPDSPLRVSAPLANADGSTTGDNSQHEGDAGEQSSKHDQETSEDSSPTSKKPEVLPYRALPNHNKDARQTFPIQASLLDLLTHSYQGERDESNRYVHFVPTG